MPRSTMPCDCVRFADRPGFRGEHDCLAPSPARGMKRRAPMLAWDWVCLDRLLKRSVPQRLIGASFLRKSGSVPKLL